ncbi:GAF and ANTAR domain-containing protein [Kineococcus rhizosphaerae]|uniref:GAF domain-containing protein n=1 Tax=Kineococcus rhizosphaerae TaxID=559628 RepID=A0A2T0R3D1_9ACTN|nr:GAF and ANTAR domain-containing protein [Kineococcus rhizosphaerae]PRY14545.1 GAF domain-containing protein [Kineococcus rhizosphaerae]
MSRSEANRRLASSRLSVVRDEPLTTDVPGSDVPLAAALAGLARELQTEAAPRDVVQQAVASAAALIGGVEHASISLVRRRRQVWSAAVTDETALAFDRLQEEVGEGPCLDAMFADAVVRTDDLRDDPRWPVLAVESADLGVRSMLCFQLFVHENTLGGLNLLSSRPAAFDGESELVGSMVAAHAAVALAAAQKFDDLTTALSHRDVIGQAKGILMERFKLDADQAFALLARISQDRNVKLHHLAEQLTRSGSLDR